MTGRAGRPFAALAMLHALGVSSQAGAQDRATSGAITWLEVRAARDGLTGAYPDWSERELRLERRAPGSGGAGISARHIRRFGVSDMRYGVDAAAVLNSRLSLGLDLEGSPSHRIAAAAGASAWGRLGLGAGWGVTGAGGRRSYRTTGLTLGSISVERYWSRYQGSYRLQAGRVGSGASLGSHHVRFSRFGEGASTASVSASLGREAESVTPGSVLVMDVRSLAAWGTLGASDRVALTWSAIHVRQGRLYERTGASVGVRTRL